MWPSLESNWADMDLSDWTMTHHTRRRVHRVAKQTVAWHLVSYHTSHHRSAVDANNQLKQRFKQMRKRVRCKTAIYYADKND